jgi:hypothetical protein
VRPPALARDHVQQPVAVDVAEVERVELGEADPVRALRGRVVHQAVLDERHGVALAHVLEPREPEVVRREGGDDVAVPVPVDVGDQHLRSALAVAELERVEDPDRIGSATRGSERAGRLLVPAFLPQDVLLPVAVEVADAEPVREASDVELLRDRMEGPRPARRPAVGHRPPEAPFALEDEHLAPVAEEVGERRRLVVDRRMDDEALPGRVVLLRIGERVAVPVRLLPREADLEEVGPAVAVDVGGPEEEAVRVPVRIEGVRLADLVHRLEVGRLVPQRAGDHVLVAVAVEIGEGRALAREPEASCTRRKRTSGSCARAEARRRPATRGFIAEAQDA